MAPTSGFLLSALPRSPDVPARIGQIDAREIYDSVRQSLSTAEQMRSATGRVILADEQMRTGVAENQARQDTLPTLTQATLTDVPLRSQLLAQQVEAGPAHTRLLAAQAAGAESSLAANQSLRDQQAALRAKATAEMPSLLQEREAANKLAGYNESAAALGNLRVKYPWIALPEFKDTLGKSLDEEQQAALKAASAQADRESRESIATTRSAGTVDAARARAEATKTAAALRNGPLALLSRQAELIEAAGLFPDDPMIAQQLESVNAVLRNQQASEMKNPNAAKVSPPAGLVLLQNKQKLIAAKDAAQAVLDQALDDGDPEVIAAAQADYNTAAALAADATNEHQLYHAERTKKISKGIDAAAIDALASKLTGGKTTPPAATPAHPTGAKTLTPEKAAEYLKAAGGDKTKARELARKDGWSF